MKRIALAAVAAAALGFSATAFAETDVSARGGVEAFTGGGPIGPQAGVQVDTSVNRPVGLELSYDGARIPMNGSAMWAHDVDAQARLSPIPRGPVRPFVAGGLGVGYFDPEDNRAGNGQWSGSAPLSVGVAFGELRDVNIGVRGTYKYEFSRDLGVAGSPGGNLASADLTLGGRF